MDRLRDLGIAVIDYTLLSALLVGNAIGVLVLAAIFPFATGSLAGCAAVFVLVRWINRRDDPRHVKLPRDHP